MARKSNKTAHVLNLLAGQDTSEEAEKEPEKEPDPEVPQETSPAEPAALSETPPSPAPAPQPEVPSHISIIDNGSPEEDPVAEQIRAELLKNLEPEEEEVPEPQEETAPEEPEPPAKPEVPQEPEASQEQEIPELKEEAPVQAEPPAEPEPDYVRVNVMERIVEDKIIYFMKQFEVCTCDRCKTDTIALTLNGLPPKYMVMDKAAVDPMVSFLTGRLISQVTVEAVKACTQVKEHPRHETT